MEGLAVHSMESVHTHNIDDIVIVYKNLDKLTVITEAWEMVAINQM